MQSVCIHFHSCDPSIPSTAQQVAKHRLQLEHRICISHRLCFGPSGQACALSQQCGLQTWLLVTFSGLQQIAQMTRQRSVLRRLLLPLTCRMDHRRQSSMQGGSTAWLWCAPSVAVQQAGTAAGSCSDSPGAQPPRRPAHHAGISAVQQARICYLSSCSGTAMVELQIPGPVSAC